MKYEYERLESIETDNDGNYHLFFKSVECIILDSSRLLIKKLIEAKKTHLVYVRLLPESDFMKYVVCIEHKHRNVKYPLHGEKGQWIVKMEYYLSIK